MEHFNDLIVTLKANAGNIFTGFTALLTTVLGYKVMFGKNNNESKKISVELKNADLAEDKLSFERATAIDLRMDRLVAHLERQLEIQNEKAQAEREAAAAERAEMRGIMNTQTREIRSLKQHIDKLAQMITSLGGVVPNYKSPNDNE